jgi:hypothetical protein
VCKLAPVARLYIHKLVIKNNKEAMPDHFLVLTKVESLGETFERVGLAVVVHKTAEKRDA